MKTYLLSLLFGLFLAIGSAQANDNRDKIAGKNYSFTLPYPNPANDHVVISYNLENTAATSELVIHNVLGATVLRKELAAGAQEVQISLENLQPGMYFYSLTIGGNSQFTRRLVIKR
jgi:hypothetical protein